MRKNLLRKNLMGKNLFSITMAAGLAWASLGMTLTSCTVETSDNGDLDGFWHLEEVDTLATGGRLDLSADRIFWGVQYRLISCARITTTNMFSFRGYYFRFEQTADSLVLHSPYKNNWHQDQGDNGGDLPATAVNDSIRSYGINNLREPFYKERLKGSKMTLRSKTLRLHFTKF